MENIFSRLDWTFLPLVAQCADDAADTDDADDAADDIADEQMNRWEDTRVDTDVFKLLQNGKWSVGLKLFALRSYKVIGTINLKLLNVNKKCK